MKRGPLRRATGTAINTADHLTRTDEGAVQLLREVAGHLDVLREGMLEGVPASREFADLARTYLRTAEALGLTPAARHRLGIDQPTDDGAGFLASVTALTTTADG